jgi:serine protease Do
MSRSQAVILAVLVTAVIAGCIAPNRKTDHPAATPAPAPAAHASAAGMDVARQLNEAFISVAENVSPAVVVLEVTEKRRAGNGRRGGSARPTVGEGSGIIVTKDGYILTNHHVVENADKIEVYLKDAPGPFVGEVRGTDPQTDIAVVKIDTKGRDLPVAVLGDSDRLRVGEFVVAIGHPLELTYSVTVGHVSAIARQLPSDSYAGMSDDQEYIQTDAVINPGNSGGPLINLDGEVIAVNDMMEGYVDPITGFTQNRGIGLAIPINEARLVKDRLISDGKFVRSIIGIHMTQATGNPLAILGMDGVTVAEVTPNGPAEKAGLKTNDVIVAIDGKPVKTARDLRNTVTLMKPGQSITVSVRRANNSKPLPIKVVVEAEPPPATQEAMVSISPGRPATTPDRTSDSDYGFTAKALTKELAAQYGVKETTGVIITAVRPLSLAAQRGIQPGDIIEKMNAKQISTMDDFEKALKTVAPGKSLTLNLKSKGEDAFKVLRAPSSE